MKLNTTIVRIDNNIYSVMKDMAKEQGISTTAMTNVALENFLIHIRRHPGLSDEQQEKMRSRMVKGSKERRIARYKERMSKEQPES